MSSTRRFDLLLCGARWPVLPMLMPAAWTGGPAHVSVPVMRNVIASVPQLTLAHIVDQAAAAEALPKCVMHGPAWLASQRASCSDVMLVAITNLAARAATWQPMGTHMLECRDDYLAPERMLLPAFLREGAARLRAVSGLVVAAPQRGVLMATPTELFMRNRAHATAFHRLAHHAYDRAGVDALFPYPLQTSAAGQLTAVWEALP